jgi:HK97 gp10 family phage protein
MTVRVIGLKIKEVCQQIVDAAMVGANDLMDESVVTAKRLCPVGTITRKDGQALRDVLFVPKTGRGKGKTVNYIADTWIGRNPGSLRATIRKVEKYNRRGNLRVYAGNSKVFYARFTEYGTASTGWGKGVPKQPFMRPAFQSIKGRAKDIITSEMRKVPEVRS